MARTDPRLLTGKLLIEAGLVTEKHLDTALGGQSGRAPRQNGGRVGSRLVAGKAIAREVLEALLRERDAEAVRADEALLGRIAVRNGFITEAALAECLADQQSARDAGLTPEPLGRLLVLKRLMTEQSVDAVLHRQKALKRKG